MSNVATTNTAAPEASNKNIFGFWVYLMTDCLLFASLFATYAVLRNNIAGGPAGKEIFDLPFVLVETIILLTSSFTCGLATIATKRRNKDQVIGWFAVTFLLGIAFLSMELTEFRHLYADGHSWQASAFLSSFFTLVGTHGLHITTGLLWMLVLLPRVYKQGITETSGRRLLMLSLFWHFLDLVWIFIFSMVYLMGAV